MSTNGVSIPPERRRAAHDVAAALAPGRRVALTTHVNADGDGVGSEVALWHLLGARGLRAAIANPTPIPDRFQFLVPDGADHSERATREIESADVVVVLDISDVSRLGDLARAITHSHTVACIDHHISGGQQLPDYLASFRSHRVDRHPLLVAVDLKEEGAGAVVGHGRQPPILAAVDPLDPDHLGPEVAEQAGAIRAGDETSEVEHADPGQDVAHGQSVRSRS